MCHVDCAAYLREVEPAVCEELLCGPHKPLGGDQQPLLGLATALVCLPGGQPLGQQGCGGRKLFPGHGPRQQPGRPGRGLRLLSRLGQLFHHQHGAGQRNGQLGLGPQLEEKVTV